MNRNSHSFFLFPVTEEETNKAVSKLKVTHTDKNHIPVSIFKSLKESICVPLCKIINTSFRLGKFPKVFKLAKISPIHKKNSKNMCENYRPISCLPFISKIFERVISHDY